MSCQCNNNCPLVPWKTYQDNLFQERWCPYTQTIDYKLHQVYTGGNQPIRENYSDNQEDQSWKGNYRPLYQTNWNLMGSVCSSGYCPKLIPCIPKREIDAEPLSNFPKLMKKLGIEPPCPCSKK